MANTDDKNMLNTYDLHEKNPEDCLFGNIYKSAVVPGKKIPTNFKVLPNFV